MRSLIPLSLFAVLALPAQALTATDALRAETETRARNELTELFRSLCPEQCLLLSVVATVEEVPSGASEPGFEAVSGGAKVPQLQGLSVAVLVDDQVPASFRTRLKDVVSLRTRGFGVPPSVSIQPLAFPSRAVAAPAPLPQLPVAPPIVTADPEKPQPASPAAPIIVQPAQPRLESRLVEAAPALAAVGLLAVSLLVIGTLLFFVARRQSSPPEWAYEDAESSEPAKNTSTSVESYPIERAQRLERTLTDERALRNSVLRTALAQGEAALVARWLREMGDFLIADLYAEPGLTTSMNALSAELAKPYTSDPTGRAQALSELEGRLMAARLSRTAEAAQTQFDFLEGLRPERFFAAYQMVSQGARETALRFAPLPLRTAILRRMAPAERAEVALAWTRRPEITRAYAAAVVDEWKAALAAASGSADQSTQAIESLFDLLSRLEQDALLERLKAEGATFVDDLPAESRLLSAPLDAVSSAALSLPPGRLVIYLSGADDILRERVLEGCPTKQQRELREELGHGIFASRDEFLAARRLLLDALRSQPPRRRDDPPPAPVTSLAG